MSVNSDRLASYRSAEALILEGQEVQRDGRKLRMADLVAVQAEIRRLERIVAAEEGRGGLRAADFRPSC